MQKIVVVKRKSQGRTERYAVDRSAFSRNVFDRWVAPLVEALTDDYRREYKGGALKNQQVLRGES